MLVRIQSSGPSSNSQYSRCECAGSHRSLRNCGTRFNSSARCCVIETVTVLWVWWMARDSAKVEVQVQFLDEAILIEDLKPTFCRLPESSFRVGSTPTGVSRLSTRDFQVRLQCVPCMDCNEGTQSDHRLAQWVEQRTSTPSVAGSTPVPKHAGVNLLPKRWEATRERHDEPEGGGRLNDRPRLVAIVSANALAAIGSTNQRYAVRGIPHARTAAS